MTGAVSSGLRLMFAPSGELNAYIWLERTPPDFRRKSSECSRIGVSIGT